MLQLRGTVFAAVTLSLIGLAAAPAGARPAPPPEETEAGPSEPDPVTALRAEIERLRRDHERRIAELEARLAELEGTGPEAATAEAEAPPAEAGEPGVSAADLDELRAAAEAAAAEVAEAGAGTEEVPARAEAAGPAFGKERNLNRLNPEISMTGTVQGFTSSTAREELQVQEFELDLQSALDPFSFMKWTLDFDPEEGVDIEEGYIRYPSLKGGLGLTGGSFRQSFGVLNRWHLHALPQADYPSVLQDYFGEEGLAQTGVSLEWLLPRGWADANQLTLQVTDGSSDAFGGEDFERLAVLGRVSNYWDLTPATYFELGFSGIDGRTAEGGRSRVWGSDLTLDWTPPSRAKYREVTWRTEILRSERDDPEGLRHEAWGGYSYLEALLARNLWAGVRYDRVEQPLIPDHLREGIVPYLTWWQSEYVRFHGEYRWLDDDLTGETERGFSLQLVWAAGPHKHERY
jgi:hypothetical protein